MGNSKISAWSPRVQILEVDLSDPDTLRLQFTAEDREALIELGRLFASRVGLTASVAIKIADPESPPSPRQPHGEDR